MSVKYYKDKSGNSFRILEIDGKLYAPICDVDILRKIPNVNIRDDDIIICGFMRSGTHWTYEMLSMLLKGKAETVPRWKGAEQFEFTQGEDLDKLISPRVLNTHLLYEDLPKAVTAVRPKIVFLVRDPRDVAVSNYNVYVDVPEAIHYSGSWDDYLDLFMTGRVQYDSWYNYILSWEDVIAEGKHDFLVIHYEDTHKNPLDTVHRLADFCGLDRNEDLCSAIVEKCVFDRMKEDKKNFTYTSQAGKNIIYRKGVVGDWKNWFTVAQCEMFDNELQERMGKSKLVDRYLRKEKLQ